MESNTKCVSFDDMLESNLLRLETTDKERKCVGEHSWINDVIVSYNKLEFFTWSWKPGECEDYGDGTSWRQRALVRGMMKPEMANFVHDNLKVENIIVRTSRHEDDGFDHPCKLGSVTFTGNKPDLYNFPQNKNEFIYKPGNNLETPLYNEYEWIHGPFFYPNLTPVDLVDVQIFDIRWNDNSTLWSSVLDILVQYSKS